MMACFVKNKCHLYNNNNCEDRNVVIHLLSFSRRMILLTIMMIMILNNQLTIVYSQQLQESDRVAEYKKRNYTWPLNKFRPNTIGFKNLILSRLEQVRNLQTSGDRYEGFYRTIHTAHMVQNFTEYGFGLGKCPDELLITLQQAIHDGLPTAGTESISDAILSPQLPLFIERWDLTNIALHQLLPYAEAWANVSLVPHQAYGFRLYRNESQLYMHVDRMATHIISMILHIDSSDDAEPWPIYIEDFHGNTHEVILTPGDILFYESSKCFHGRPKSFNGSWYTSLFIHYYPIGWDEINHELEAHYAVPPVWDVDPPKSKSSTTLRDHNNNVLPTLALAGTSMKEPDCPNSWCRTMNTIKWSGPGEHGYWIAPNMERYPLTLPSVDDTMLEL